MTVSSSYPRKAMYLLLLTYPFAWSVHSFVVSCSCACEQSTNQIEQYALQSPQKDTPTVWSEKVKKHRLLSKSARAMTWPITWIRESSTVYTSLYLIMAPNRPKENEIWKVTKKWERDPRGRRHRRKETTRKRRRRWRRGEKRKREKPRCGGAGQVACLTRCKCDGFKEDN